MQTFLPLPDYLASMRCLDKTRLGNQVWREGITLIRGSWPNHPASKMWRGHEYHLGLYLIAGCQALSERGKSYPQIINNIRVEMKKFKNTGPPRWLGDPTFHASHRSNLLRKVRLAKEKATESFRTNDPKKHRHLEHSKYMKDWYSQFDWQEPDDLPYVWPI